MIKVAVFEISDPDSFGVRAKLVLTVRIIKHCTASIFLVILILSVFWRRGNLVKLVEQILLIENQRTRCAEERIIKPLKVAWGTNWPDEWPWKREKGGLTLIWSIPREINCENILFLNNSEDTLTYYEGLKFFPKSIEKFLKNFLKILKIWQPNLIGISHSTEKSRISKIKKPGRPG